MSDWNQIDQSDDTHTDKSKPKRRKVTHGKKQKTMPERYLFFLFIYFIILYLACVYCRRSHMTCDEGFFLDL
jgi:hypothetical protein